MNNISKHKVKFTKTPEKLSKLRQELVLHLKKRAKDYRIIFNKDLLMNGGVYFMPVKCGKPNCKCATTSYRHGAYYLYTSQAGKSRNKYIKPKDFAGIKKLTENYKKFRKARASLMKIQQEMAVILDQIEKEKTVAFREGKSEKKKTKVKKSKNKS